MKRKILAIGVVVAMLAIAVVSGTLAYFTDTENVTNTFTVGNVDIELTEWQNSESGLVAFENNKQLMPGAAQDKFVKVENIGSNDAYVRVVYTIPAELVGVVEIVMPETSSDYDWIPSADGTTVTCTFAKAVATKTGAPIIYSTVKLVDSFDWIVKDDVAVGYKFGDKEVVTDDGSAIVLNTTVDVRAEAIQATGFDTVEAAFAAFDAQVSPAAIGDTETVND